MIEVFHNFYMIKKSRRLEAFSDGSVFEQVCLKAGNKAPTLNLSNLPSFQSFKYRSLNSYPFVKGSLVGSRCVSRAHLARRWELINGGEERHDWGDGDTCHCSSTSWSVTDKYSPWDMNLLQMPPTELKQTRWKRQRGKVHEVHSIKKSVWGRVLLYL